MANTKPTCFVHGNETPSRSIVVVDPVGREGGSRRADARKRNAVEEIENFSTCNVVKGSCSENTGRRPMSS